MQVGHFYLHDFEESFQSSSKVFMWENLVMPDLQLATRTEHVYFDIIPLVNNLNFENMGIVNVKLLEF